MQPIHIVAIIVRLFAIGLFIFSIERVAMLFLPAPLGAEYFVYYMAAFTGLFGAVILWNFPTLVSKKIIPLEPDSLTHEKLSLKDWYRLSFVILGVFLLLKSISDLFYWLTLSIYSSKSNSLFKFTAENKASIITTFFELAIAVLLIFSARYLITLIQSTKVKT